MFLFIHIREMLINFIFKSVEVLYFLHFKTIVWENTTKDDVAEPKVRSLALSVYIHTQHNV